MTGEFKEVQPVKTVTASLGPRQAEWLEYIKTRANLATDEEAVRVAISAAYDVMNPEELAKLLHEALKRPGVIRVSISS